MPEIPTPTPAELPAQPLSRALRPIIIRSITEAQLHNAPLVEAEHLLLALSHEGSGPIRAALAAAGLDPDGVDAALTAERAASLRVAGVTQPPVAWLAAAPRVARPRWGTSARDVLVRAHRAESANRRRQGMSELDLLTALLSLELGTVPRALTIAGVDRPAVLASATASAA